jgi:hypothetical protein
LVQTECYLTYSTLGIAAQCGDNRGHIFTACEVYDRLYDFKEIAGAEPQVRRPTFYVGLLH